MVEDAQLKEWMLAAQQGDQRAYQQLLQAATLMLRAYLKPRVSDHDKVDDILQEVLVAVHKARHTYDGKRAFRPWLYAIARYKLMDHFRNYYRKRDHETVDYDTLENILHEDVTDELEQREYVSSLLAHLKPRQQEILRLMHVQGYTAEEVANKLDMSQSAVKVAAHRAYKQLKDVA